MKKGYLVGGLAVLGAVALIAWYKKPKKNSEGFFGATGKGGSLKATTRSLCSRINSDGSRTQYTPHGGSNPCPSGGVVTTVKSFSKM